MSIWSRAPTRAKEAYAKNVIQHVQVVIVLSDTSDTTKSCSKWRKQQFGGELFRKLDFYGSFLLDFKGVVVEVLELFNN